MKHRKLKASVSILLCVLLMVSAAFSAVAETDPVADAQAKIRRDRAGVARRQGPTFWIRL